MVQAIHDDDALAGKAVFITGAASGLGAALSEVLARSSADIVVGDPDIAERAITDTIAHSGRLDLLMPEGSVVAEITVLPMQESSWP